MRMMATKQGQYCNVFIEPGWVFDLRDDGGPDAPRMLADGNVVRGGTEGYPIREDWIPKLEMDPKTKQPVDTGEGEYKIYLDRKTKKPVHRDFSEDEGVVMLRRGPIRGETIQVGWMRLVSEEVPITEFPDGNLNDILAQCVHGFNPDTRKMRMVSASKRPDPLKDQSGKSGEVKPVARAG
jgi:hypothetical protein